MQGNAGEAGCQQHLCIIDWNIDFFSDQIQHISLTIPITDKKISSTDAWAYDCNCSQYLKGLRLTS